MPASTEVQKRWGEFLHEVRGGRSVVVTVHGRPVARVSPAPRDVTQKSLADFLDTIAPELRQPIAAAVRDARAALLEDGFRIDEPFALRAAAAIAAGAYRTKSETPAPS